MSKQKHHKTKDLLVYGFTSLALCLALGATYEVIKISHFDLSQNETTEEGITRMTSLGAVKEIAAPDKGEFEVLLNDPNIKMNWGLASGLQSDIKATRAWAITRGSKDVVVAIIDTGADVQHKDLMNNLWVNAGEQGKDSLGRDKATNGVDDDKNGCVDDVHGCNFITNTGDLTDNHGHGTHVAGIVGAEGDNGWGSSGVSPKVSLMILKYYDPKAGGQDNLRNTIRAIKYAVQKKATIINYSGGGLDYSGEEYAAVKEARDAGILFIAAAGNEKSNSDFAPYYPANYALDNIISVTAVNPNGKVLQSSNFGERSVHLAAPGESIKSTVPGNKFAEMTGTSQATAFVTGVAALVIANNREFDYHQVRRQVINTADATQEMVGKSSSAGILNAWAALAIQPSIPASGAVVSDYSPANESLRSSNSNGLPTASLPTSMNQNLNNLGGLLEVLRQPAKY
jgi:subtilisin family serine protease